MSPFSLCCGKAGVDRVLLCWATSRPGELCERVTVTLRVPLLPGHLPLDFPLPWVPPGAFARRLSLPRAAQVHQLLREGVRVHAPAVHPVPRGLGPLQDPPAPRQDKMLQVHLEAGGSRPPGLSRLHPEAGEGAGGFLAGLRVRNTLCYRLRPPPRSKRDALHWDGCVSPALPQRRGSGSRGSRKDAPWDRTLRNGALAGGSAPPLAKGDHSF